MTFSMALTMLKKGVKVTRTKLPVHQYVHTVICKGFCYLMIKDVKFGDEIYYELTNEDLFAEDWKVYIEE